LSERVLAAGGKSKDGLRIVQDLKIELKRGKIKPDLKFEKGKRT
jgi:hypothetical protein